MSKVSVFDHGWIDLVFEGRNQNYGAYQLRKQDSRTTLLALFTGIGVMVLLVSIPTIINKFKTDIIITDGSMELPPPTIIKVDPYVLPEVKKPDPIEQAAGGTPSSEPTVAFTNPVAVSTPTAPVELTTEQVLTTNAGTQTTTGVPGGAVDGTSNNPTAGMGAGPATGPGVIENFVDVAPLYPGGLNEFRKDVANRFKTPDVGNLSIVTVLVAFVVEPDGTLSNIKATRDPGYGMGAEAIRVLKSLKAKWAPGMKGGKAVRTAYSLPITVKVN